MDLTYRLSEVIAMVEFSLDWIMGQAGSAEFVASFPQEVIEVHTTYVGDGLGSIVKAANDLRLGSSSAIAFLPAEPGGTCLFFSGAGKEAYLQIVQFADMQSESGRWGGGVLRWHGKVEVTQFIRGVTLMAEAVLVQCGGAAAYSKAWGGIPFPAREMSILTGTEPDPR
ncbi:hypothetical protein [Actinomadura litoris]|uniref:hypothetical protein n=1 Tax=Actinomadura litoris TaxID=2678616 RepID=UPI001FA7079D|nr:hypothetical protein [Actinomadura litoris]